MKAAIVQAAGQTPVYADLAEPTPAEGEELVTVTASALSPLARARASGHHYSASGNYPFVAGVDGVGRRNDGTRVFFMLPRTPHGSMAERTVVASSHCLPLPGSLEDVAAAAIANPGMSSWAALTERAHLQPGETVLVNGATGISGRLAVQIARHLGAAKIIATGRNEATLRSLDADIILSLADPALNDRLTQIFAQGLDVVIDYLWGQSAERILAACAKAASGTVRFVQVGSVSGPDLTLPSDIMRSSRIELMGSGLGSVPLSRLIRAIGGLFQSAASAGLKVAANPIPLSKVEQAWPNTDSARRTVFTIGG